jgi:hypothetical protein
LTKPSDASNRVPPVKRTSLRWTVKPRLARGEKTSQSELRSHFLPLNSCTASSMATMFSTGVAACTL